MNLSISFKISGFSKEDKSPKGFPVNFAFNSLRIILPVRVFGKSDNWHDVAKAWPDLERYEYTGREIKIVDNI